MFRYARVWLNFTLTRGTFDGERDAGFPIRALVEERKKAKVRSAFGQS